jgi:hypothetical protein
VHGNLLQQVVHKVAKERRHGLPLTTQRRHRTIRSCGLHILTQHQGEDRIQSRLHNITPIVTPGFHDGSLVWCPG